MRYQEALAYRVVQVNGTTGGNEIELPVTQPGNNTVQVLTSPLNGQFYVIGNANDVFTTAQTSRSLVPRTTTLQIETPRSCTTGLKKVLRSPLAVAFQKLASSAAYEFGTRVFQRDDRRRATHNEVERRRRDKINNWIAKLGKIIPECNATANANGSGSSGEGKTNYETQVSDQSNVGGLVNDILISGKLGFSNDAFNFCVEQRRDLGESLRIYRGTASSQSGTGPVFAR